MKRLIMIMMLLSLSAVQALAETYTVDPSRTRIEFKVKNLGITNVRGSFEKFKGVVYVDEKDLTRSRVDVTVETASISTGINMRDNHLRTADFFDVAKYPAMTFVSTKVEAVGDTLKLTGNLTIKGVTKPVTLTVNSLKSLLSDAGKGASASATVNRQDFGLGWGMTISDEVTILVSAELVKQEK